MNTARFSLNRPVTVLMIALAVIVLGVIGFTKLKIDLLPDITFPVIAIVTAYPGTPPEEVEEFVTKPVEEAAAVVKDLKTIRSISRESLSAVILEFEWGTDMDAAAFDTREKIDPVIEYLPADVQRPFIVKMDPATIMPVLEIAVTGLEDMARLREITDDVIKPELEKAKGVASATIYGGLEREILVRVDRPRLDAYGLSLQQIEQALRSENLNLPAGRTTEGITEYTIRVLGQFQSVDEIPNIAIGASDGTVIRLAEVAQVEDTHKEIRSFARLNGQPGVALAVVKQSAANTVEVSDAVRDAIAVLPQKLPSGVEATVTWDQAEYIRASLENLYGVAFEGAILAIVIIFFFLATVRNTLVVAVSIPMSLITTFVLMYFNHMTLNIVTMGGLVLAIGRIVDDSIVVLENIHRHMEEGEPILQAAILGTQEVAMAIAGATFTTMAVFFPLIFVGGMVSELFTPMSLVVMFGLFASLIVALTLVPLLCSRFIRPRPAEEPARSSLVEFGHTVVGQFGRGFHRLTDFYLEAVTWALGNRGLTVAIAGGIFIISLMLIPLVGLTFFPDMDQGDLMLSVETPIASSVEYTDRVTQKLENIVMEVPELENVVATGGEMGGEEAGVTMMMGGGGGTNSATLYGMLVDRQQRTRTTEDIENELREKFALIPGITVNFQATMGGGMQGSSVEITIRGDELEVINYLGKQAMHQLSGVPGLYDLDLDWRPGKPEYQVFLDREKAGTFGITASQVAATLQTLVRGTAQLTKYREKGKEYDITVRGAEADREWIEAVKSCTIVAPHNGELIPLTEIAKVKRAAGPTQISRDERRRAVAITADTSGRALSEITKDCDARLAAMAWPEGYSYEFGGAEEDRREAFGGMFVALIMGLLLIYMILASQFESLVHPFTIMLAIPLEVIGVIVILLLTQTIISVMVLLGILMLTGIVVSNSILLVNIINILRERGMTTREAIIEGGRIRLRPILMTALATVFAMIPMALGMREGSEMWKPLALATLGGLIASTALTLLVVPVVYSLLDQLGERLGLRRRGA